MYRQEESRVGKKEVEDGEMGIRDVRAEEDETEKSD